MRRRPWLGGASWTPEEAAQELHRRRQLTAQVLNGPQSILITASDPGPGVYRAIFQVDGKEVSSSVLNNNGGRCESVGGWART